MSSVSLLAIGVGAVLGAWPASGSIRHSLPFRAARWRPT